MQQWLIKQREDLVKRLKASEQETLRLQGALAMLDETLRQARTQQPGAVATPPPAPAPAASPASGMTALRIGVAPVQAEHELRE